MERARDMERLNETLENNAHRLPDDALDGVAGGRVFPAGIASAVEQGAFLLPDNPPRKYPSGSIIKP